MRIFKHTIGAPFYLIPTCYCTRNFYSEIVIGFEFMTLRLIVVFTNRNQITK
jgi:hypothetical protein